MADEKSESQIKNDLHATSMGGGESLRARRKKAENTAKKDKLQQEIQKEIVDGLPQLESAQLKQKLKELDKKIEEAKKLEEEEQKTISSKTENKVSGLKKKFDPNNMENLAKFLTNDSEINPKLLEKVTGKAKKAKSKTKETTAKATKIDPLSTPDNDVVDILKKILTLMQKSYDDDKLESEKSKNLEEGLKEDKEKKEKELLDAVKEAKDKKDNPTVVEEKEEEESFMDKLLGAFGLGSAAETALTVLGNVAKFFLTSPLGLGLLAGASLFTLLTLDKHADETNKGIQNAGKADGGLSEAITEAADDEVASKRATLLRQAHKDGKIKASWYEFAKQGKEEEDYLKSVGFDPKTGKTLKEREEATTSPSSGSAPAAPSPAAPTTPPAPVSAAPESKSNNLGQKLNQVTKENVFDKLDEKINSVAGAVVNNTSGYSSEKQQTTPAKLPAVRNQEETFMRMIYNNTRVV